MRHAATISRGGIAVTGEGAQDITRTLPEEVPVAMVFHGTTRAVMMATPDDLEDFAFGFALTEGFIDDPAQVTEFELVEHPHGIEARFWLADGPSDALEHRTRAMMGPTGCGLCGIDSLDEAMRKLPALPPDDLRLPSGEVGRATEALRGHQPLQDLTRAVHAAGFLVPGQGIVMAREDVGRHNALDKLIGALARDGVDPATGAFALTSRVSVEMVQKAVMAGCPALIAVSAPTAQALRMAEESGLTVAAFARGDGFDIYSHPHRITTEESDAA